VIALEYSTTANARWNGLLRIQKQSNAKGTQLKLAATVRSRTAGSQDESRCSAIHKVKTCAGG
jgi:hypothetical protein